MARALLALCNTLELLTPNLRVVLAKAVISQRPDARQRGSQFMRHIARKLTLGLHARRNAPK